MKNKAEILKFIKRYAAIIFGCVVFALGVTLFLDANNIASGGVTGIAIILNFVTKDVPWLNTGIWIIIINVPLFILGWIFFGHRFILSTVFSTVLSSLLVWVFEIAFKSFLPITENVLISSVLGGALFGGGLGLIFRMGSTTGGTDIVVKILRKKFRHIRTGIISMIIDMIIVGFSAIVYRDFELVCYTVVSIVVVTIAFDWVRYGGNTAKLVHIITTEDISSHMLERIIKELGQRKTDYLLRGEEYRVSEAEGYYKGYRPDGIHHRILRERNLRRGLYRPQRRRIIKGAAFSRSFL